MKYTVLQDAEMLNQIRNSILQSEKEHFAIKLQMPQLEEGLPKSKELLLSSLIRIKRLEKKIHQEKQKLDMNNAE